MEPSIFTMIIRSDIPSHKIYDDELTFAFLDIHPIQPGHVLVVPKRQVEFVWDLGDEEYQALMQTAKKIARRLREVTGATYIGEKIMGTDVPHAHVHVFPFNTPAEYNVHPDLEVEPDHEALAVMAEKLRF